MVHARGGARTMHTQHLRGMDVAVLRHPKHSLPAAHPQEQADDSERGSDQGQPVGSLEDVRKGAEFG